MRCCGHAAVVTSASASSCSLSRHHHNVTSLQRLDYSWSTRLQPHALRRCPSLLCTRCRPSHGCVRIPYFCHHFLVSYDKFLCSGTLATGDQMHILCRCPMFRKNRTENTSCFAGSTRALKAVVLLRTTMHWQLAPRCARQSKLPVAQKCHWHTLARNKHRQDFRRARSHSTCRHRRATAGVQRVLDMGS